MEGDGVKDTASGESVLPSHAAGKQKKTSHGQKVQTQFSG